MYALFSRILGEDNWNEFVVCGRTVLEYGDGKAFGQLTMVPVSMNLRIKHHPCLQVFAVLEGP